LPTIVHTFSIHLAVALILGIFSHLKSPVLGSLLYLNALTVIGLPRGMSEP
jgi:hypothetical protein